MGDLNVNSTMKRIWRAVEVAAWTAFFAFAVLLLALRFWILPRVAEHREEIAVIAARMIGQPVKIGGIEAGWLGLRPQLSLSNVRILDNDGRDALVLPALDNVLSWSSLLHGEIRLSTLRIDRPRLTVRRDAAGEIYVAGLKLRSGADGRGFSDWLLGHEEIVIRNAEIEWRDEKRGAPPLALSALNLRVRNAGDEHAIGLVARPLIATVLPANWQGVAPILTVLSALVDRLPAYDYLYLGDSARAPYGGRSHDAVYQFTREAVEFLTQVMDIYAGKTK